MRININLTPRDRLLLSTLAEKVRLLSVSQVADWLFGGSVQAARKRLRALARHRLIDWYRVLAAPLPTLEKPLAIWKPTDPFPDFRVLLREIRRERFAGPARMVTVVSIRGGRRPRAAETSHDLLLAQLPLQVQHRLTDLIPSWGLVREQSRPGERNFDALVVRRGGTVAHEVVGSSYTAEKLRGLFEYAAERKWSVVLW
jgi:hypothetical protein